MKIYFLSSEPCALTLNGAFYGITDTFERSAEFSLSDCIYAQFSPEGKLPLGFFLSEELTSRPPEGCDVYLVRGGLALFAHDFPPSDCTLRLLDQKREGDVLATLFAQGRLQLSVDGPAGFFNATLPPSLEGASLQFHGDLLLLKGQNVLGIYSKRAERLFLEQVLDYSLSENELNATLPLSDRLQRQADCRWRLSEEGCTLTSFTLRQAEEAPPEGLLAYAFFESVLLKGDFAAFLREDLRAEKENIAAFLGDFLSVTLTENPCTCGLVRKKAERLFQVDYFTVTVENGEIIDVKG